MHRGWEPGKDTKALEVVNGFNIFRCPLFLLCKYYKRNLDVVAAWQSAKCVQRHLVLVLLRFDFCLRNHVKVPSHIFKE